MTPRDGDDDLVTDEGVDEGAAELSTETPTGGADGVVGPATVGAPDSPQDDAGPDLVETPASRAAHHGQQLAEGEG